MKVYELFESNKNEQVINSIASALAPKILKMVRSGKMDELPMTGGKVGTISSILGPKSSGPLYARLGRVRVELFAAKHTNTMGEAQKGIMSLNVSGDITQKGLASTIAHELKHVLEYSYTKDDAHGTMKKSGKGTNKPGDHPENQDDTTKYHRQQTEINARLTQAMRATTNAIDKLGDKPISNEQLGNLIWSKLAKYQLQMIFKSKKETVMSQMFGRPSPPNGMFHPTDNKQYRKIIGRVFKYAKEHINNKVNQTK